MMIARGSWQVPPRLAICGPRFGTRFLRASRLFSDNPSKVPRNVRKVASKPPGSAGERTGDVGGPRKPYKVSGPTTSFNPGQEGEKLDRSIIFQISAEVESAVCEQRPVVALETTIYTHGFPYPDNLSLALDLEKIVRANGAVPATIGIIDGVAKIGLTKDEIERLASSAGNPDTMKVSRRDLPYILGLGIAGRKINGGTTVSGTMFLAYRAGIKVFGTGGLGGVHRGGQDTMDISADLTELGRTTMAVISSGCKSFLDIPRTIEFLETQGVTVCTFADGRTGPIDFPAFYTRDSGVRSPMVVQDAREAAAITYANMIIGGAQRNGMLFGNPIPEEFALQKSEIDLAIDQAVKEAAEQGFHGHTNTPFILARIKELTKGNSIPANRALIESNVTVAAKVAVELAKFGEFDSTTPRGEPRERLAQTSDGAKMVHDKSALPKPSSQISTSPSPDILVFGSVAVDLSCDYTPLGEDAISPPEQQQSREMISPQMHTSNVASITASIGGVGHNVVLAAHRAGGSISVQLCSVVAQDLAGKTVLSALKSEGLDTAGIQVVPVVNPKVNPPVQNRTAQYVAINDAKKDLVLAMADMSLLATRDNVLSRSGLSPKWSVIDANWSPGVTRNIMSSAKNMKSKVAFEPVSVPKSGRIFEPSGKPFDARQAVKCFPQHKIDLATPNQHELAAMHASAKKYEFFESDRWWQVIDSLGIPSSGARDRFVALTNRKMTDEGIPLQTIQLLPYIPTILTKLGAEGVLLTELLMPDDPRLTDPDTARYILSRTSNGSTEIGGVYMRLFPAMELSGDAVSVNGVGDTFLGILVAGLAKGLKLDENLINIAQQGAVMTLQSKDAVSPRLAELAKGLDELAET